MASTFADSHRVGDKMQVPKGIDDKELAEKCREAFMKSIREKPGDAMQLATGQPTTPKPAEKQAVISVDHIKLEFPDCFPKKK